MIYTGIDPGEIWTGFARLIVYKEKPREFFAQMGVLHVPSRKLPALVHELVPPGHNIVICEEFRQRPVGHQRFNDAKVPQQIGALQYATEVFDSQWFTVPPGNPNTELPKLIIGWYLDEWNWKLPDCSNEKWQHARSAWRVLAHWLLKVQPRVLERLRVIPLPMIEVTKEGYQDRHDLVSPTFRWEIPRENRKARKDNEAGLDDAQSGSDGDLAGSSDRATHRKGRPARRGGKGRRS